MTPFTKMLDEIEQSWNKLPGPFVSDSPFSLLVTDHIEDLIKAGRLLEKARHSLELRKRFPDYASTKMREEGPFKMTGTEESLYGEIRELMEGE